MLRTTRIRRSAEFVAGLVFAGLIVSSTYAQVFVEEEDDGLRRTIFVKQGGNLDYLDWTNELCEESEECEIEVKVIDGERIVIVNGDTVETSEMGNYSGVMDHPRSVFDRLLADGVLWHEPGEGAPHAQVHRRFEFFNDNTLRDMEKDAKDLARKARRADESDKDDSNKAELEAELDEKLSEIFDYKNGKRRKAIETTEKRLDEMRERQTKRESSRVEIIEQRRQELLGEESYLEW